MTGAAGAAGELTGAAGAAGDAAGVSAAGVAGVNTGLRSPLAAALSPAADRSAWSAEAVRAGRPFVLPTVSAGSGVAVSVAESVASAGVTAVSLEELPLAPAEFPLALSALRAAPERELPDLVRDDDMKLLSTIASEASPSGSAS